MSAEAYQSSKAQSEVKNPELVNLVDRFRKQNDEMSALVSRLTSLGHRVSDTNIPREPENKPALQDVVPFNEGHLKGFYNSLVENLTIINRLYEEVNKLENFL